ncbi:MAG: class I SAM-dependent methyltransferase [Candidatus Omnitrophica bacterium]|nr:class I SAM-dependent methyltransferase [Candidatus Omnitrophota bacterium]
MLDYFKVGNNYWWVWIKQSTAVSFLKIKDIPKDSFILDAGCGCGYFINTATDYTNIVGLDININNLFKNQKIIVSKLENLPFKNSSFRSAVSLDVLEHTKEDRQSLSELYRVISEKGYLIASVPACPALLGQHDKLHGHYRRYKRSDLAEKLRSAGFKNLNITIFGWTIFLPLYILRKIQRTFRFRNHRDDAIAIPRLLNRIFKNIISLDLKISRLLRLSWGVSAIICAQK